ncbi:MAG: glycoside hydrolase family 97 catalytic domain-containing protein [Bacteroidia bacterium]
MQNPLRSLFILLLCLICTKAQAQSQSTDTLLKVVSPNGKLTMMMQLRPVLRYCLLQEGDTLVNWSALSLTLQDADFSKGELGPPFFPAKMITVRTEARRKPHGGYLPTLDYTYLNIVNGKAKLDQIGVYVRLYDIGLAMRFFVGERSDPGFNVFEERVEVNLPKRNITAISAPVKDYMNPFEGQYAQGSPADIKQDQLLLNPLNLQFAGQGGNLLLTEANVRGYPGIFWKRTAKGFVSDFAGFPRKESIQFLGATGLVKKWPQKNKLMVRKRFDWHAQWDSSRFLPWRIIYSADTLHKLSRAEDLVYLLSDPPPRSESYDWVKPGWVLWDWYHDRRLEGVDFEAGINTATYRYYVDFAARHDIPYINIDDGWSRYRDFDKRNKDLDVEEVVTYAKQKGVGVWIWVMWNALGNDIAEIESTMEMFAKMGVVGLKIDFFDRNDQRAVLAVEAIASSAARYHLMVNLHGVYPLAGMEARYPNIVTYEAVRGLEYNKWSNDADARHDAILPYTRLAVGPADYTPGAMRYRDAATKPSWKQPAALTTRAHQLALYVLLRNPLPMLPDAPHLYEQDSTFFSIVKNMPTTWDETLPLESELGKTAMIARRKGNTWYVAIINGTAKAMTQELKLSFIKSSSSITIIKDGKQPRDITETRFNLTPDTTLNLDLAPHGGSLLVLKML